MAKKLPESLVGQEIDHFYVESLIAEGGMATVYRARDTELDRMVAIKVIHVDTRENAAFAERLAKEARIVAQLRHANIVGIHSKGQYNGRLFLVMEYINGPTLATILTALEKRNQRLDTRSLLTITGCVNEALDYAHAQGVIHRDVKPSNIMTDLHGNIYLTDFGLALRVSEGTEGRAFGSPYYMSPEQVRSSANATPQSDIYALGVVIYRMLTGRLPFEAHKSFDVVMAHLDQEPSPPSHFNRELPLMVDLMMKKALAKTPEKRFRTGAEFQDALATCLDLHEFSPRERSNQSFIATQWTAIGGPDDSERTYLSATHLLQDAQWESDDSPHNVDDPFHTTLSDPMPDVKTALLDPSKLDDFDTQENTTYPEE